MTRDELIEKITTESARVGRELARIPVLEAEVTSLRGKYDELHKTYAGTLGEAMNLEKENEPLRDAITNAIPMLEAAAKRDPSCLGMVTPPVHGSGIRECQPWPVVDEMIAHFREAAELACQPSGEAREAKENPDGH